MKNNTLPFRPAYSAGLLALALLVVLPQASLAVPPDLIADIGTGSVTSSSPSDVVDSGLLTLFAADGLLGTELYSSDGTAAGTSVLLDIWVGPRSSDPRELTAFAGAFFFSAADGEVGRELWMTDGTTVGTVLVKDINPTGDSNPASFSVANGLLYFTADDGSTGIEMWQSDGTAGGTTLLKDINPSGDAFNPFGPGRIVENGSSFYFSADNGTNGRELWKSDGTTAGTVMVLDILPGAGSSLGALSGAMAGSNLMFSAEDGQGFGDELWRSDGTAGGSVRLVDVNPNGSSAGNDFESFAGRVFFVADGGNAIGRELFVTDGTIGGTSLFVDTNPGPADGLIGGVGTDFRALGATLFFNVNFGPNLGLWGTDGTAAGQLTTANPGNDVGVEFGGALYFSALQSSMTELWTSDGTVGGTSAVTNTFLNPALLGVSQGEIWLSVEDANGREPWRTDGSPSGAVPVADVQTASAVDSSPQSPTVFGTTTLFAADSDDDGLRELWKTDGTTGGTTQVSNVTLDPDPLAIFDSIPAQLHATPSQVFFAATGAGLGEELWTTDGTTGGTSLVLDINPGAASSGVAAFADVGATTLFIAEDGTGTEPWRTDGTPAGTYRLGDLNPSGGSMFSFLTAAQGVEAFYPIDPTHAIFAAFDPSIGTELYLTDGTTAGTAMVVDMNGAGNGASSAMALRNGKVYFAGDDGSTGVELYESDGTAAGTKLVAELQAGLASSNPRLLKVAGGTLFFVADDPVRGAEVHSSDGTAAGTTVLTDLAAAPVGLTAVGSTLFFFANDPAGDLWKSDGTVVGTVPIGAFNTTGSFFAFSLGPQFAPAAVNGQLVFAGDDGVRGIEPWTSDGTFAGTMPISNMGELSPAQEGDSNPSSFSTLADGRLTFAADARFSGSELWAVPEPDLAVALVAGSLAIGLFRARHGRSE